jgi:hypothetical protein
VILLKSGLPPCITETLSTEIMNLGIEGAKVRIWSCKVARELNLSSRRYPAADNILSDAISGLRSTVALRKAIGMTNIY